MAQQKSWIQKAIKKPGALHEELGIPQGKKISTSTLLAHSHGNSKLAKRARLALAMRKFHH